MNAPWVRNRVASLTFLAVAGAVVLAASAASQGTGPQQSTSGPLPAAIVGPKVGTKLLTDGPSKTITGVPGYRWRHGCGPTAVGMVVGYHDGHGCPGLIPGDALTQTGAVNAAMASQGSGARGVGVQEHYEDYSLPKDSSGAIQPDSSPGYPAGCHPDNCIADFMQTSWSAKSNRYGWSWSSRIVPAFTYYARLRNPRYLIRTRQLTMASSLTWQLLKDEIDQDRPLVFLVDTNKDGKTDHFVTVVGYNESASGNQYGCLDTWSPVSTVRWCGFRKMSTAYSWGIWGGWSFAIARPPLGGTAQLISTDSAGVPGSAPTAETALSADGRYAAFSSSSSSLVPGDTNGCDDVFVRDRRTGGTTRVSVDSGGGQANAWSGSPAISADGRLVAFRSDATNLVAGDTNGCADVFLHDRVTGGTRRISVSSLNRQANGDCSGRLSMTADGRLVAFCSVADNLVLNDLNKRMDVFLHDVGTGITSIVSLGAGAGQANADCEHAALSADGLVAAFRSAATNLVASDTNGVADIFVRELSTAVTVRVSVDSAGAQANGQSGWPSVSANGRLVAFASGASNLVTGDTNSVDDVFLHDRQLGRTTRVSTSSGAVEGNGAAHERPSISAAGDYVVFASSASNLVAADGNGVSDVFVHDVLGGRTERASVGSHGGEADGPSRAPAISSNGRLVAFISDATNLAPGDVNNCADAFVHDGIPSPTLASIRTPRPGATVELALWSPDDANRAFVMASSLGYRPGIRVDSRRVPLDPDPLFGMSFSAPSVFSNFVGVLDGSGQAAAAIHLPAIPQLAGHTVYTAFVTLDGAAPSGIRGISNAHGLQIVP